MSLFAAIKSHLLHDSRIALLVGDRVFHMMARRAPDRPYIVFQIIGRDGWRHMTNVTGVVDSPVQIIVYGDSDTEVHEVSEAVRKSLDHLNHRTIGRGEDSLWINAAFLEDAFPGYDSDDDGGREWGVFSIIQEWRIVHKESLPLLAV